MDPNPDWNIVDQAADRTLKITDGMNHGEILDSLTSMVGYEYDKGVKRRHAGPKVNLYVDIAGTPEFYNSVSEVNITNFTSFTSGNPHHEDMQDTLIETSQKFSANHMAGNRRVNLSAVNLQYTAKQDTFQINMPKYKFVDMRYVDHGVFNYDSTIVVGGRTWEAKRIETRHAIRLKLELASYTKMATAEAKSVGAISNDVENSSTSNAVAKSSRLTTVSKSLNTGENKAEVVEKMRVEMSKIESGNTHSLSAVRRSPMQPKVFNEGATRVEQRSVVDEIIAKRSAQADKSTKSGAKGDAKSDYDYEDIVKTSFIVWVPKPSGDLTYERTVITRNDYDCNGSNLSYVSTIEGHKIYVDETGVEFEREHFSLPVTYHVYQILPLETLINSTDKAVRYTGATQSALPTVVISEVNKVTHDTLKTTYSFSNVAGTYSQTFTAIMEGGWVEFDGVRTYRTKPSMSQVNGVNVGSNLVAVSEVVSGNDVITTYHDQNKLTFCGEPKTSNGVIKVTTPKGDDERYVIDIDTIRTYIVIDGGFRSTTTIKVYFNDGTNVQESHTDDNLYTITVSPSGETTVIKTNKNASVVANPTTSCDSVVNGLTKTIRSSCPRTVSYNTGSTQVVFGCTLQVKSRTFFAGTDYQMTVEHLAPRAQSVPGSLIEGATITSPDNADYQRTIWNLAHVWRFNTTNVNSGHRINVDVYSPSNDVDRLDLIDRDYTITVTNDQLNTTGFVAGTVEHKNTYRAVLTNGSEGEIVYGYAYTNWSISTCVDKNRTESDNSCVYNLGNDHNTTSVVVGNITNHTLVSTYNCHTNSGVEPMAFTAKYGTADITVTYGGKTRTDPALAPTMTQTFNDIRNLGTSIVDNGAYEQTSYNVLNNVVFGYNGNQRWTGTNSAKINIKVETPEDPIKGRLVGLVAMTKTPDAYRNLQNSTLVEWTKGYEVFINGVSNGFYTTATIDASIRNSATFLSSVHIGGGVYFPAKIEITQSTAYGVYSSKNASTGQNYSIPYNYGPLGHGHDYWKVQATGNVVGNNYVIIGGGYTITIPRY